MQPRPHTARYFTSDDDFHWNYGIACASTGDYKEAKESLLLVQNEKYKVSSQEFCLQKLEEIGFDTFENEPSNIC